MNLYINACARKDSRTNYLARKLLEKIGDYEELNLYELDIKPINEEFVNKRNNFVANKDYSDKMFDLAKKVAEADNVVIGAPFWDMSFPSILKVFIENIYCVGIVCAYGEGGKKIQLCKGNNMYFVSTAGGKFFEEYGYNYIKEIFVNCFGFKNAKLIKAEMLDIVGKDPNKILEETKIEL